MADRLATARRLPPLLQASLLLLVLATTMAACGREGDAVVVARPENPVVDFRCAGCNLLLVSIDTLRADRLSLYGHTRPTSPNLDRLAAESVVFDTFIHSGGGTLPSHMSMMTSLNPSVHRLRALQSQTPLGEARVTLAEALAAGGYRTAAFVDAGWVRGKFGFAQGFEIYDDAGGRFAAIRPKAEEWLNQRDEQPFFLFVHSYDVHSQQQRLPYDCPGDFPQRYTWEVDSDFDGCIDGRCASRLLKWINAEADRVGRQRGHAPFLEKADVELMKALYDGCINYADEQVALLIDHLRHLGLLERTMVVITSDHGEEFFEQGLGLHAQGGYDTVAHIPLIVRWPDGRLAGRRVPHLAAMIDLMPTLLDVLDRPVPEEAQGRSLMPAVVEDRPTRSEMSMYTMLRTQRWKLMTNKSEMFDLGNDPAEQVNLWASDPAVREELSERMRRLIYADRTARERLSAADADSEAELAEDEVQELKALGYL